MESKRSPAKNLSRIHDVVGIESALDRTHGSDGLAVFLHQYVPLGSLEAAAKGAGAPLKRASLAERLRAATRALEAVKAAAEDVDELMGGE